MNTQENQQELFKDETPSIIAPVKWRDVFEAFDLLHNESNLIITFTHGWICEDYNSASKEYFESIASALNQIITERTQQSAQKYKLSFLESLIERIVLDVTNIDGDMNVDAAVNDIIKTLYNLNILNSGNIES